MDVNLRHCHNCGSLNVKPVSDFIFDGVKCSACQFEFCVWDNIQLAIRHWNLQGAFGSEPRLCEQSRLIMAQEVRKYRENIYPEKTIQLLQRLDTVNKFIEAIANCGRGFFRHEDRVAWIERGKN